MLDKIIEELKYWRSKTTSSHFDKKTKEEYYKKCYDLCVAINWQIKELKSLEEKVGLTGKAIFDYARTYATTYLQMPIQEFNHIAYKNTYDEINRNKKTKYLTDKYNAILEQLRKIPMNDKDTIINVLNQFQEEDNFKVYWLRNKMEVFVHTYYPAEGKALLLSLDEKVNIYIRYINEQKTIREKQAKIQSELNIQDKKKQKLDKANYYINEFLKSNESDIEAFCANNQIDSNDFNELLTQCRKYNPELYNKYLNKLIISKNDYNLNSIQIANQLVCLIKNGIKSNTGPTRAFDVIDYHCLIGIDFKDISLAISNTLKVEDLKIIKTFFKKNTQTFTKNLLEIEKIKQGKTKLGFSIKDEQNNLMIYYPTREEMELVIDFLEENNIPLNEFNYTIAIKRYLNKSLPLNKNNHVRRLQPN